MKKKILYLILLLCVVAMPLGVSATTIGTGSAIGYSAPDSSVPPGQNGGNFEKNNTYTVLNSWGIRISLVDKDGNRVAQNSANFFNSDFNPFKNDIFIFKGNYNKREVTGIDIENDQTPKTCLDKECTPVYMPNYKNPVITITTTTEEIEIFASSLLQNDASSHGFVKVIADLADSNDLDNIKNLDKFILNTFNKSFLSDSSALDWYLLIEPIRCINKEKDAAGNFIYGNGEKTAYVCGTVSEFSKYASQHNYKSPYPFENFQVHFNATWNWLYIKGAEGATYANFKVGDLSSTFTGLTVGSGQNNSYIDVQVGIINGKNGNGVGLIWLGKNAKKDTCKSVTSDNQVKKSDSDKIVSPSGNFPSGYVGYYDKTQAYSKDYYINAVCYSQSTTCSSIVGNATYPNKAIKDKTPSGYIDYYSGTPKYDARYYVNAVCYSAPVSTTCGEQVTNSKHLPYVIDKGKKIKLKNEYDSAIYEGYYDEASMYNTDFYVNSMCFKPATCEEYYYKIKDFTNVPLDAADGKFTNCCKRYEDDYKNNSGVLNRLYRDHPECYSCSYTEHNKIASCSYSSGANEAIVGDSFDSVTRGGVGDNQTCAYYVASGKIENVSPNLVTERVINSYCKVVCTETIKITFPLLNRKYFQKGSFIVWPSTNLLEVNNDPNYVSKFFGNSDSNYDSSKLIAHGTADCWYYVDTVGLSMLRTQYSQIAADMFIDCATDFKETYNRKKNIINYDLKGNYSVEYNDPEPIYKNNKVSLSGSNDEATYSVSVSGSIKNLNNLGVSYSLSNLKDLVSAVESVTFEVDQTKIYSISESSGYNYIYDKMYYTKYDDKWGKNSIKLPQPVLGLSNKTYNNGELKIHYSSIGGGEKKYSSQGNIYQYSGAYSDEENACKYSTVDVSPYHCPEGTDNEGMYLNGYMQLENLSYEEAIKKYCYNSSISIGSICPSDTSFAGRKITDDCYKNEICRNLTCNQYACTTQDGKTDKLLNSCISDEMEKDSSLTFDSALKKCEKKYCGKANLSDSVEYRVIDLNNPFPGIFAKNNGIKLSNGVIVGRTPGQNWNSASLVSKEILNNRGVSGDEVYSLDPLFEFDLTTSVMQKIRSYNDKHDYDDFTLRCTSDDKEACVARGFNIRSKDYGNISTLEACKIINDLDDFNRCYNS